MTAWTDIEQMERELGFFEDQNMDKEAQAKRKEIALAKYRHLENCWGPTSSRALQAYKEYQAI